MFDLMSDLRKKVPLDGHDVVLGFTSQYPLKHDFVGTASYFDGYILVRMLESESQMRSTLQHELSHLFGAVDIVEKSSVMGTDYSCNKFDEFTSQIIFYNKYRSFNPYVFPLPEDKLDEAVSIYNQRKRLTRREVNINIMLASIFLEKEDYDSVIEECCEAVKINPDLPEIYNFLGIAYRRKGEIDQAIKEYEKVILLWPQFPEIHYNLGIALMKKGMIDEAVKEYLILGSPGN